MNRKYILVSLTVFSLLSFGLVMADDFSECKKELQQKVVQDNPRAESIVFEMGTHKNNSKTEILYEGAGSFIRHSGEKEFLTWQCTVDKGIIKEAHYGVTSDPGISSEMVSACENGIRNRIHSEKEGSGAVTFDTFDKSKESDGSKRMQGKGHVVIKGKEANFDYQCAFDAKGNLTNSLYQVK